MKGKLYSVAIPIGNAEDITYRAADILNNVDIIACESINKVKSVVYRSGLHPKARFLRHHSINESDSAQGITQLLQEGKSVALVTDAGTPRISDPGYHLLKSAWENKDKNEGVDVVPIPGVSSLTTLISVCPLPIEPFLFLGFITPKEKKRENLLEKYNDFQGSVIFLESVHRIKKLLTALLKVWNNHDIFIGRELTKIHEEFFLGTLEESIQWIEKKKGEFVFLLDKR